ncbi:Cytochrome P450 - like 10 [Theobroma cacao]|nr:Cytochrome P450 - like 10 [Theobroma cacao]
MDGIKREGSGNGSLEREDGKDLVDVLLEIQKDMSDLTLGRDSIKAVVLVKTTSKDGSVNLSNYTSFWAKLRFYMISFKIRFLYDLFSGGTDTTDRVLEWAMTELLRHPRVMKILQNEVREIGSGKPNITEDDINRMDYLKAVIKETLRLHPPLLLLVPRVSTQDVNIKGYDIEERKLVIVNAWAIGRDPVHWNEPEEFRPERFLNNPIGFKGNDFQYTPFGDGRRGCPGMAFAMAMNEIILVNQVHKFDWSLPGGTTGEDLDMTETTGIAIHRKVPLPAVATPTSY